MEFSFLARKKAATLGIEVGKLGKDMFIHRLVKGKGKGCIECLFTFVFFFSPALLYPPLLGSLRQPPINSAQPS